MRVACHREIVAQFRRHGENVRIVRKQHVHHTWLYQLFPAYQVWPAEALIIDAGEIHGGISEFQLARPVTEKIDPDEPALFGDVIFDPAIVLMVAMAAEYARVRP